MHQRRCLGEYSDHAVQILDLHHAMADGSTMDEASRDGDRKVMACPPPAAKRSALSHTSSSTAARCEWASTLTAQDQAVVVEWTLQGHANVVDRGDDENQGWRMHHPHYWWLVEVTQARDFSLRLTICRASISAMFASPRPLITIVPHCAQHRTRLACPPYTRFASRPSALCERRS